MTKKTLYLTLGMFLILGVAGAVSGYAQTADGQTPAEESVCDEESGAAFGLCNAYCEAMDCHLLFDGNDNTTTDASEKACLKVLDNYIKLTGKITLPCDATDCVPGEGGVGCACETYTDCADGMGCDDGECILG